MSTQETTMIRPRMILWVAVAGLLCWAGCAPVGEDTPDSAKSNETINAPKIKTPVPDSLKDRVKAALDQVRDRDLLTSHAFWTVFHAILGNGLDAKIRDTWSNKEYVALDYIRKGGHISGLEFIGHENALDGQDGVDVKVGPIFQGQGHQDQFVAEMAQLGLPLDADFAIQHRKKLKHFTFADFIRYSKAKTEVKGDAELSWTILAVSQFYGTQVSWTNKKGEAIHFEDVVRHEVNQPIETAACGGTHRLFGLTWAYHIHLRDGGKMTSVWQDVAAKLKKYHDVARKFQNADGSFSTDYLRSPSKLGDMDKRIGTTGHVVEWLALYLTDDELREPWMQEAVNKLVLLILDSRDQLLDGGSIYHAAHGLHLYYHRVWAAADAHLSAKVIPLPPKK